MFSQAYTEFELIGRGNFGTAHLVRSRVDNQVYVAKKIILAALKDKEQQDALRESSLLQKLIHPHIVAYKESFSDNGTLIIVMEYCEEGDLSFHIKRKRQREEHFPEKVILNWFLQCAMALNFIHQNKILHRDIKSSNIFVTSNGFVKIGDFGISRVLEHTYDSAQTVVGTPYYMSPEVCENKPYTYKSDVWALGCVLYELCTLKHAFDANNLLGLVYKIVKDQVSDIPNTYSKELQNLVKKLLCKSDHQRPSIGEILQMDFIQREMKDFITNQGRNIGLSQVPIKRTQTHQQIGKMIQDEQQNDPRQVNEDTQKTLQTGYLNTMNSNTIQSINSNTIQSINSNTIQSINASEVSTLTPQQRLKLKKEQEAQKQRELMEQAARENRKNVNQAHQKRINDLAGSGLNVSHSIQHLQNTQPNQFQQTSNQRHTESQREFDQTLISQYESTSQLRQSQLQNYDQTVNSDYEKTLKSDTIFVNQHQQQQYLGQTIPFQQQISKSQLDRFTNSKQKQNQEFGTMQTVQTEQQLTDTMRYADEEFEEYYSDEEYNETRLTEKAGLSEVDSVISLYKSQLEKGGKTAALNNLEEIREVSLENSSTSLVKDSTPIKNNDKRVENLRKSAIAKFGPDQFNKIYSFMSHHRQKNTPEDQITKSLVEMVGKQKYRDCQIIDEIIYIETCN